MHSLGDVFNEWQNNPQFRKQFALDPQHALQQAGFQLSAEDLQLVCETLKDKKNLVEELEKRINK